MINIKRIYEQPVKEDGYRILIDRLWPRGLTKEHAAVNLWRKDIAPSDRLRKWFSHDPKKWTMFQKRYLQELSDKKNSIEEIHKLEHDKKIITLVYGAKDQEHNNAVVLKKLLMK